MISIDNALRLVLDHTPVLDPVRLPLGEALGLALAEPVCADLDSPPFDKALMDGYAVRAVDLPGGRGKLPVAGVVMAGAAPPCAVGPGHAVKIMTGAVLPAGADAVVKVEQTAEPEPGAVEIDDPGLTADQHILRRGAEMRAGQQVLGPGHVIRAPECGLLGSVGRTEVAVGPRVRVAILVTGDEVVEPGVTPEPGQIRNSNASTLSALTAGAGGEVRYLGIAGDAPDVLAERVEQGLASDILLVSGGVSMGDLDLVPHVLAEAGVTPVFHKVAVKPGKPIWFGRRDRTLVFGLPGNPVSLLVAFELLVRSAMKKMTGLPDAQPALRRAVLAADHRLKTDRPTFYPVTVEDRDGRCEATALPWLGSADLCAVTRADALMLFPPGDHTHKAGAAFDLLPLR